MEEGSRILNDGGGFGRGKSLATRVAIAGPVNRWGTTEGDCHCGENKRR